MKRAYNDWVADGKPPRIVHLNEDDEFINATAFDSVHHLLAREGCFDVVLLNTKRTNGIPLGSPEPRLKYPYGSGEEFYLWHRLTDQRDLLVDVPPFPATHSILTTLKDGEAVYQTGELP